MIKYRGILIAAAAAAMLCACSGKSVEPVKEMTEATAETESRRAEIQILDETPAPVQPETSAQESIQETTGEAGTEKAGQAASGAEVSGTGAAGANAVKETEAPKVYSVEAFEKTMYATANVNVRTSYTTKSEVLTSLAPGQKVKVTGRSANGWMRVIYEGRDAFVYQKYLSDNVPDSSPSENLEPEQGVTTYPGNQAEDPPVSPGQIPIVEPAPVMTAPEQNGPGSSVTQYGPGMLSPGGGSSRSETIVPGTGPGM